MIYNNGFDRLFSGLEVLESIHALENTFVPIKKHSEGKKESYNYRIQKKWNKRFGFIHRPVCYQMGNKLIAHPAIATQIRHIEINNHLSRGNC